MTPRADTFRRATPLERIVRTLPRGGPLAPVRHFLRGAYARMLGGRDGVLRAALPGGETFAIDPEWRHITWNPDEYAAFRAAVRPGDVVIEAGANVGCYAVLFGHWVGPAGRVFAFEPDPRAFAGLARHVELNGLTGRVIPVQAALSDTTADLPFSLADAPGVSRIGTFGPAASSITVRATTVDAFCASECIVPAVLKIDVEGAELAVLRGARQTLLRGAPTLFVELHPTLWWSLGLEPDVVRGRFAALGLEVDAPGEIDPWTTEGISFRFHQR